MAPLTHADLCIVGLMVFADEMIDTFPDNSALNDASNGVIRQYGAQSPEYQIFLHDVVQGAPAVYRLGAVKGRAVVRSNVAKACAEQYGG